MGKGTIKWELGESIVSESTRVCDGVVERNVWEVVEKGKIIVREVTPHTGTYLQVGQEYPLFFHEGSEYCDGGIWEIGEEDMDRDSSQMLLYDWETGPSIELDF